MIDILSLIERYKTKIYDDKIFFYPHIPVKKLKNAIKKYAHIDTNDEEVLMLIDDTVMGSAKSGLVMTTKAIYVKDSNSEGFSCLLENINSVSFKNYLMMQKLIINNTLSITFTQANKNALLLVSDMLREINTLEEKETSNWTKIGIGIGIGALFGGPIGAAIGASLGAFMEEKKSESSFDDESLNKIDKNEILFVTTLASVMAKMAKADGQIVEEEAELISSIFDMLEFDENLRKIAVSSFKYAKSDSYSIYEYIEQYSKLADDELKEFLYDVLWQISMADGELADEEKNILQKIPQKLNLAPNKYDEYYSKYFFKKNDTNAESNTMSLEESYSILNSTSTNTLREIKIEYRKLVAEYHPDKIQSKGLPESFVRFATEQLQKINLAYEIVQKYHV